jgi:hypothetical protein
MVYGLKVTEGNNNCLRKLNIKKLYNYDTL